MGLSMRLSPGASSHSAPARWLRARRCGRVACRCRAQKPDADPEQVREWARAAFKAEVHPSKPAGAINLAKACMLLALEEDAAGEAFHATNPPIMEQAVQQHVRQQGNPSQRAWERESGISEAPILWDMGSASTWSLARLDSIAADVRAAFLRSCGVAPAAAAPAAQPAGAEQQQQQQQQRAQSGAEACGSGRLPAAADFPMLAISAANEVMFQQHGYRRQRRHGDPRDAKLSQVLERGYGCPAALSIAYMEVCGRAGLPLRAALLEGRYCLLWPALAPLRVGQEDMVIDAYCQGELYRLSEVRELYGLGAGPLQPAGPRELLAALLGGRDVHWAKAVGCRPEPALLTPIAVATAMSGAVPQLQGFQMQRAVAAAERTLILLPGDGEAELELAVLLFFAGRFADALALAERTASDETAGFRQKLRFLQRGA